MYEIGKLYDSPRPCPKCGHTKAEFRTTATCYGEWWKCTECGEVFGTYEWPHNKPFPISAIKYGWDSDKWTVKCPKCGHEFHI